MESRKIIGDRRRPLIVLNAMEWEGKGYVGVRGREGEGKGSW